jgi:hypothetical protein
VSANEDGHLGGARLLAGDVRVATLLMREGRHRACARLFGVSSDDSGIVTVIALATLAHGVHGKVHNVVTAARGPTAPDMFIGAGMLKETVHVIAGDWSREAPVIPVIIVGAVIAHHLRPWARVSLHDVRALSRRLRVDFGRRYGHVIRPDRPRPLAAPQLGGNRINPAGSGEAEAHAVDFRP